MGLEVGMGLENVYLKNVGAWLSQVLLLGSRLR